MSEMKAPTPAGFGNCPQCAYFGVGPAQRCYTCAKATIEQAAPYYCTACGQQYNSGTGPCINKLCSDPNRYYVSNTAIAMKTGPLDTAIKQHKYHKKWGWGVIAARVLLGYLPHWEIARIARLIIPMPAFLEPEIERKGNDQAGWTLESAIEQQDPPGRYPFRVDPPVIIKTASTPKMATAGSLAERRANAVQLYLALNVVDSAAVRGKIVVVYDDVFTTGATLNAVARRLREAGAHSVYGLTLARAPWR